MAHESPKWWPLSIAPPLASMDGLSLLLQCATQVPDPVVKVLKHEEGTLPEPRNCRKTTPTAEELSEARTDRSRKALISWYRQLDALRQFKLENGNCDVPQKCGELGNWVNKQREQRKLFDKGERSVLNERKVELLDSIGFSWGKRKGATSWEYHFEQLQAYKRRWNHCLVPTKYRHDPAFGRWISTQRCEYKLYLSGESKVLDKDRVRRLEAMGFSWSLAPQSAKKRKVGDVDGDSHDEADKVDSSTDVSSQES